MLPPVLEIVMAYDLAEAFMAKISPQKEAAGRIVESSERGLNPDLIRGISGE